MDKLDLDKLMRRVGGRFKLTRLVQLRMRELQRGHPPLIDDLEGKSWIQIAVEEIALGRTKLLIGEEAKPPEKPKEKRPLPDVGGEKS